MESNSLILNLATAFAINSLATKESFISCNGKSSNSIKIKSFYKKDDTTNDLKIIVEFFRYQRNEYTTFFAAEMFYYSDRPLEQAFSIDVSTPIPPTT